MLAGILLAALLVLVAAVVVQGVKVRRRWRVAVRIRAAQAVVVLAVSITQAHLILPGLLAGLQQAQVQAAVRLVQRRQPPQVPEEMDRLEQAPNSEVAAAAAVGLLLVMAALVVLAVCMLAAAAAEVQQQAQTLALGALAVLAFAAFTLGKE